MLPVFRRKRKASAKKSKKVFKRQRFNQYKPYPGIRGTNPQNVVRVRGIGMPDRLITNLVYSDSLILDPSAGTPTPYFVINMASAFDPQFAIGGGQPTYWDQLALIYKKYQVVGCKVTANFSYATQLLGGVGPSLVGIECSDIGTIPTGDAGTLISSPNTSFELLSIQDGTKSVVATYSPKNTFPNELSGTVALTSASPALSWLAKIFASPQGTDVEQPINLVIMVEYCVEFSDLLGVVDA